MAITLKAKSANLDLTTNVGQTIKGEDGGYYTPSVDDEGNLTWEASKGNMPAIEGANIIGPVGEKGESFTYEDFTAEQLEALRGPEGKQGQPGPKGDKGDTGATGSAGKDGKDGESPFVYGDIAPTDTTKIWVTEDEDVEQIVYSDDIRKIIVVDEYPEVQEQGVLYIKPYAG